MSLSRSSSGQTVHPGSRWRVGKTFYVLVFVVTGIAVYRWGVASAERTERAESCTSTATVFCRTASPAPDRAEVPGPAELHPQKISQQITSTANLRRAVREVGSAVPPMPNEEPSESLRRAVERMRRNLRVTATETATPGELLISLAYSGNDARYAALLVNTLAEHAAGGCRAGWKAQTRGAYREAADALESARRGRLEADAHLDAFLENHFHGSDATWPTFHVGSDSPPRSSPAPAAEAPPSRGAMVDNPAWIELAEQLSQLRRQRTELLADRTLYHPEVQHVELRIAETEEQLGAIPKRVPHEGPEPAGPAEQSRAAAGPTPPAAAGHERTEAAGRFRELKQAAEQAAQLHRQAAGAEREAWQAQYLEPQIELALAQPGNSPPSRGTGLGVVLMALAAAVVTTAGVGMISTGAAMEPTLDSDAQAEAVLPVPVAGIVPATNPAGERPTGAGWRPLVRLGVIVGGLVLIAGVLWVLIRTGGGL